MNLVAVLDACVLFSSQLRDVLLEIAKGDLYRAVWSEEILGELDRAIERRHAQLGYSADFTEDYLRRLHQQLAGVFPDSCIANWQISRGEVALPDPGDLHVVGAALAAGASLIVTSNLRDFPQYALPEGIEACGVDPFLCKLLEISERNVWAALEEICRRSGRKGPALTVDELIDILDKRHDAREFASRLS